MLHAVEDGLVTLIGATTENPYFEVNQALLSRCTVIELEPLTLDELRQVIERGARELGAHDLGGGDRRDRLRRGRRRANRAADARARLGDGRRGRTRRSRSSTSATPRGSGRCATTGAGDRHYDLASAFIKSMRGSDPDAAVYYLAAMLEGGEDPRFLARRIVIAASEDVGNADPRALLVAVAAAQAVEHVGLPEAQLNLAQAAIYIARAPKSNASARAIWDARADVRRDGIAEPPAVLRGSGLSRSRGAGSRAVGYVSPHDDPAAAVVDHLPEGLRGRTYYVPSGNGEESEEDTTSGDRDG